MLGECLLNVAGWALFPAELSAQPRTVNAGSLGFQAIFLVRTLCYVEFLTLVASRLKVAFCSQWRDHNITRRSQIIGLRNVASRPMERPAPSSPVSHQP